MKAHLKLLIARLLSYLPSPLPVGMTEFGLWQESILKLSLVPDNESTRFALAVMILHLDAHRSSKSKNYFVRCLNKSAANELANAVAMDIKVKQKARIEAENEAAKKAALTQAPTDGPQRP